MGGAITTDDNVIMFWEGEGIESCDECCHFADYLCDWPMGGGKTCSHKLCDQHAHAISEDRHLCPIHAAVFTATGALTPIKMKRIDLAMRTARDD